MDHYELALGRAPGDDDITDGWIDIDDATSYTISNMTLEADCMPIFASVKGFNGEMLTTTVTSKAAMWDTTPAEVLDFRVQRTIDGVWSRFTCAKYAIDGACERPLSIIYLNTSEAISGRFLIQESCGPVNITQAYFGVGFKPQPYNVTEITTWNITYGDPNATLVDANGTALGNATAGNATAPSPGPLRRMLQAAGFSGSAVAGLVQAAIAAATASPSGNATGVNGTAEEEVDIAWEAFTDVNVSTVYPPNWNLSTWADNVVEWTDLGRAEQLTNKSTEPYIALPTGLELTHGETYYLTVKTMNSVNWEGIFLSMPILIDVSLSLLMPALPSRAVACPRSHPAPVPPLRLARLAACLTLPDPARLPPSLSPRPAAHAARARALARGGGAALLLREDHRLALLDVDGARLELFRPRGKPSSPPRIALLLLPRLYSDIHAQPFPPPPPPHSSAVGRLLAQLLRDAVRHGRRGAARLQHGPRAGRPGRVQLRARQALLRVRAGAEQRGLLVTLPLELCHRRR